MFSLTELGNRLKEAREEKNFSLEDLQTLTKIQKRYLVGIEEGNYAVMPGKFYVRAFIKQYCEAVDLDPDVIFEEYKNDIPTSHKEELPTQLSRVRTNKKQISSKGSKVLDLLPILLLTVFIIGGLVALWLFLQNRDSAGEPQSTNNSEETEFEQPEESKLKNEEVTSTNEENENEAKEEPAVVEDEVEPEPKETIPTSELLLKEKNGLSAVYELKSSEGFILDVSAIQNGETWVGIMNGKGNTFFSGLMKDGVTEQYDLSKETDIRLNIGRTLDTVIKVNGQILEFPFDPSEKVQQKITILFNPDVQ
ncbi:DUF4115 domain-containing protein [Cytobacillus sp. S13-E01]|uniref:helix-turn-helix domain-containing protein n=1 Tax=Cytobacillus sp. S13-E01 TaxID=3031326 RepID=UPI0023D80466|nr:helix-turn-helix domain-containing protein [Cytobacillus sp. S13-E01]MDF0725116.1 DUF4115 domain-containing protein [Cytobacillus sp. S13-E01]